MGRSEGSVGFAVLAGAMFLVSCMGPIFIYAFNPGGHDMVLLGGFAVTGLGLSAALYGISTVLTALGERPAPRQEESPAPAATDAARADLMSPAEGKKFASPQEMMSSIRTLIELENWKLAHQRAFELVEAYPDSEEAAKAKKNLEYLQQKAAG